MFPVTELQIKPVKDETKRVADIIYSTYFPSFLEQECSLLYHENCHIYQEVGQWNYNDTEDIPFNHNDDEKYIDDVYYKVRVPMHDAIAGNYQTLGTKKSRSEGVGVAAVALDKLFHYQEQVGFKRVCYCYAMMLLGEYDFNTSNRDFSPPDAHHIKPLDKYIVGDGNHRIFAMRLFNDMNFFKQLLIDAPTLVHILFQKADAIVRSPMLLDALKSMQEDASHDSSQSILQYLDCAKHATLIRIQDSNPFKNGYAMVSLYENQNADDAMEWWLKNQK